MNGPTLWDAAHEIAREKLGSYQRVHVIDGKYHRQGGNVNAPPKPGSTTTRVVGAQMRCGIEELFNGRPWNSIAVHIDAAQLQAAPCERCFA